MGVRRNRFVQHRKACGYTQEELAHRLGVERSTVVRWEHGTTEPQPWTRPDIQQALQITADELNELLADDNSVLAREAESLVLRKPDMLSGQTLAASPGVPGSHGTLTSPALHLDELRHIAAAVDDARRYADTTVVTYLSRQLATCANDDGAHGPRRTLPPVLGALAAIEYSARQAKPAIRKDLLAVGAQGAEFAGWLYRDTGSREMAAHWRDRAIEWAQESGDYVLQGYVLLRKSQAAWDERDAPRMLTLAEAALEGPWHLPPKVQAEAAQQQARAIAMLGDDRSEIERKLDQARQLVADDAPTYEVELDFPLNSHYGAALFSMQMAICYGQDGQYARAVEIFRDELAKDAFSHRDYGYFLSLQASALASAGEPDEASTVGIDALSVASSTDSTRTMNELARLSDQLQAHPTRPAVRDFREALMAV